MASRVSWFEVRLHNAVARCIGKVWQHDHGLTTASQDWAQTHFIAVHATDVIDARWQVEQKYPPDRGFVIEAVYQA